MNYEAFLKEKERVECLSVQEQKDFYAKVLEEEQKESGVRMQAYFEYASLYYFEGDFRKAREVLEPFAISYQSYEYIPFMIKCFNLMGVASQCEGEYVLSRYFYKLALKIVEEHKELHYYAYEYNNIALTYIVEHNYEQAYKYILKAEKWLAYTDKKMGAIIYLNKSDIYNHFDQLDKAVEAFEICEKDYDGYTYLPDDMLICGVTLYYHIGDQEKYNEFIEKLYKQLDDMYASEFIDACEVIFNCNIENGKFDVVEKMIEKMDSYMAKHPNENKVGLKIEQLKYTYARKINDCEAALKALEKKNDYYGLIVSDMEKQRTVSMDEYFETHQHLEEAVRNEMQANRAKTRFLANMSHDIRTPMNAIMGITNLMSHALDNPEKMENYLAKIQLSSRHMMGLINDLLDMNKIESGTVQLNAEPLKIADQLMQIQDIVRTQIEERGQNFEVHIHHIRHENLIADAVRLRQVIINVLSNAIKYTPKGGTIQLVVEEIPSKSPDKAGFHVTVTDNGIGIEKKLLEHIFEPFIRGEDSVVNKIQGTGLGMAITKNIVDMMEGTIKIDSELHKGTTVEIVFEFDIDKDEDAGIEPLSLLVISKNAAWQQELAENVLEKPITLAFADDIEQAVQVLADFDAEAVLLDKPWCDAASVSKLRAAARTEVLVIALEAAQSSMALKQFREIGIHGKVSRPFFLTNLEKELNRIRSDGEDKNSSVLNGMRFGCAEDNELNAEILAASLKIAGADCMLYSDGTEIVNAFEAGELDDCDAILMDIQMPKMNGYEATKRIRSSQRPLGQSIPIIAMTANAFIEDVKISLASGMNAHVSKPLDMAVLESTVRKIKTSK